MAGCDDGDYDEINKEPNLPDDNDHHNFNTSCNDINFFIIRFLIIDDVIAVDTNATTIVAIHPQRYQDTRYSVYIKAHSKLTNRSILSTEYEIYTRSARTLRHRHIFIMASVMFNYCEFFDALGFHGDIGEVFLIEIMRHFLEALCLCVVCVLDLL
ncbi:hypothetical protein HELRODRAFT_169585 [Helobdella robusta]|uniref:Uncharacterized protein n=1 Tax=Helobdella robusta TaxID=6412 RepID=T1F251_HELRO|nr:hypothetical protein HELRODRAFT_169585 [Helobdella robusta]ESO07887.1 hypothetical protein HELRODRAFT_169585 [Helobdella robusta]